MEKLSNYAEVALPINAAVAFALHGHAQPADDDVMRRCDNDTAYQKHYYDIIVEKLITKWWITDERDIPKSINDMKEQIQDECESVECASLPDVIIDYIVKIINYDRLFDSICDAKDPRKKAKL